MSSKLQQFVNCRVLRNHKIITEDLWIRDGKIIDPEKIFFDEKITSNQKIDCRNLILAPGYIELQINGGYGTDFTHNTEDVAKGVEFVAQKLLSHGITSFCPTVVTSSPSLYRNVLPNINRKPGGAHGATVLGVHVEGPFLAKEKKGAHDAELIKEFDEGFKTVEETYGSLENVQIVTLAPELKDSQEVIKKLVERGITVSLGHSVANLFEGEAAVCNGASFITHLFNAMLPFHHRDPGLVGLLTTNNLPACKTIYYGIISDGIHTHPAALRIAYRAHPKGVVLVTDAISALGLEEGTHYLGEQAIEIKDGRAKIAGTDTLCGSIATMEQCVKFFLKATGCSIEIALEAASLHPAKCLGISDRKGTLNFGADADFVILDDELNVNSTWIAGECVYRANEQMCFGV